MATHLRKVSAAVIKLTILIGLVFATLNLNEYVLKKTHRYTHQDIECLAQNIYHEARGEGRIGQLAVAQVTLNRLATRGFPDTICEVVYQYKQFSWTLNKKPKADEHSRRIALEALYSDHELTDFEATHFHTHQVKPTWRRGLEKLETIGNHVFYK